MESSSVWSHTIVPDVLNDSNYKIWSSCMKDYLLGQDLWDAISLSSESLKRLKGWRKKNALALHAIKISCGTNFLPQLVEVETAKEAWDLLAAPPDLEEQSENGSWETDEPSENKENETTGDDPREQSDNEATNDETDEEDPFVKAVMKEDLNFIRNFSEPGPFSERLFDGRTSLHYIIEEGMNVEFAELLVEKMTQKDLETVNNEDLTTLACGANLHYKGLYHLLELMVQKHPNLPNIGTDSTLPVIMSSWNGFRDTTRFLYKNTDENILNPEHGRKAGVNLLVYCIQKQLFDIAKDLVTKFPKILQQQSTEEKYPIHALAETFSSLSRGGGLKESSGFHQWMSDFGGYIMEYVHHIQGYGKVCEEGDDDKLIQARELLELVCNEVKTFDSTTVTEVAYEAMVEAATVGTIEFIDKMLTANPYLIWANDNNYRGMFWYAAVNRQEKVFNVIYKNIHQTVPLLNSQEDGNNNILHSVAKLAPSTALDRTSGPALQMQRELQWFKEVWDLAEPQYREELNSDNLKPRELFTKSHEKLLEAGESWMKDIAQSSTVVGSLIITIMFAAAFTVPGGNNQDGYPLFANATLFKIYIVCDACSLYSSATSVLIFLGILTSRYTEDDFLLFLPRKLLIGIFTLFFSITTMMVTFCAALAIMLNGRLQYILPIVLLAFVPVILFFSSIFPLLSKIYKSTFGTNIFDKKSKPLNDEENKKVVNNPSSVAADLPNKREDEETMNNSSSVDRLV